MKRIIKTNIRVKLIISLFSVVIITGVGAIFIGLRIVNTNILGQAYDDVQSNLNTAQYIYKNNINVINLFMKHLASLTYLKKAVIMNDRELLINKLLEVKRELDLDILNITDSKGKILVRSANHNIYGDDVSNDIFIRYVLKNRILCSGTNVIKMEHLLRESKSLSDQAFIDVVPTPMARKRERRFEDSGMVLMAASPISYKDKTIGVIYGAKLLNNNFDFVDGIKNLVFKNEKINGFEIGTATIFHDDLRISTNVKKNDGSRAIGTQVSEEVYSKVVEHEKTWLDKAFVVNNWYISAYSPIYNIEKSVIGILYVGILEEKYNIIKRNTYLYYLAMMCITAILALVFSIYLLRNIITPIKSLVNASKEIAKGNYNKKINIRSDDEMGYLCSTFNKMIDAIDVRDKKLKEQTERQIVQSEKLASLGRLASGIAHEINNPLTGVLGFGTALMDDLKGSEYQEDMKIIIDETKRCRDIVKGILDFARETTIEKEPANINKLIDDTLSILNKHVNFQNIKIIKKFTEEIPEIPVDKNQIRSVINNLAVNAADAMPNGGQLTLSTYFSKENKHITIEAADTGIGISEENLSNIFDPFFSTKDIGKGTGLGLSVTYRIIERHNGSINVKSKVGEGTSFYISLPMN